MSYAAPFNLLSLHQPDRDDPADERLTWPLAGSLVIHAFVFIAFLSLRFASSFEQSSGSYEVTLVTLPEIATSPAVSPENKSKRNARKVPSPKAQARQAVSPPRQAVRTTSPRPQARAPKQVADTLVNEPKLQVPAIPPKAVTPPPPVSTDPKPILKQNAVKLPSPLQADDGEVPKPELVTDSLMGALDSVVVPKPQAPVLSQEAEPIPAPSPAPVKQSPALEMNVQPVQAPPKPPKLVVGKSETPTPSPRTELLAQKLKQRVDTIAVPKKPKQASSRVTATSASQQKQDTTETPRSSGITLPSRVPRLAAVRTPEVPKKETMPQTARNSSTVESLTQAIQSVRVPETIRKSKTPQPDSEVVPLIREPSPKHPRAAEARNIPRTIAAPQAPQLAKVPVEQAPVSAKSTVPKTRSEPDILGSQIAKLAIPELSALETLKPVTKQTESGSEGTLDLRVAGFCSPNNPYWGNVEEQIDRMHRNIYRYHHRVEAPAVLTFRVMRNGQVADLDVVRSSGNNKFDLVAKRAVLAAVPLPPFPANMTKPFCQVQHQFKVKPNR